MAEKKNLTFDLSGKVAVVTGGGGVLCSGFSKTLAAAGAKVAVCDLRKEAAQAVADEIVAAGGVAIAVGMNVLDADSVRAARDEIVSSLGDVDLLLNGAGGNNPKGSTTKDNLTPEDMEALEKNGTIEGVKTFFDLDPEGISFVFNLNFLGTLIPTQIFARDMAKRGGNIINVSSMNSFRPLTRIPAYSGAKAAVSNFTQWLAVHFAPVGIRVNAIAPGFFLTNQNRNLLLNADGSLSPRSEKILGHTPMGRFGVPEDLDGVLLWLADDKFSAFVDGVVVPVDGGFAAYSGV
ncbi:MAG: SDR family oxidoreductase [Eubacteriales bacterium]|jgi:short-chain dehydrogenase/reductase SDR|nr:SDR family oxidoreductase [Clostridiales bacterium]MDD7774769.1 SDR family oxidoreductase [Eubacteriales bacterium]MDY3941068.1 SDR family oxidoreductase [Eubacteriales bacterium]